MRIIIVSGLSGSGKSTAIHAFEDKGYFCVDNLPVVVIPSLIEAVTSSQAAVDAVVLGIDARERSFLDDFDRIAAEIADTGHSIELFFLEARDEVLIQRFSATRRRHPLPGADIRIALEKEKEILARFRIHADHIIDSSNLSVHQLKRRIQLFVPKQDEIPQLTLTLLSFGYKYGVPLEADLMFDVRFLPNPYFVENLRPLSGLDEPVSQYVMSNEDSKTTLNHIESFLEFSLPLYEREGKSYLTVGIGCTGGRHRSVAMVDRLTEFMKKRFPETALLIRHRDKDRPR